MFFYMFFSYNNADAASVGIRTNPPIMFAGFSCSCSLTECTCKQGDIQVSVMVDNLNENSPFLVKREFFGEISLDCMESCLNVIGKVTSVKLPFSFDELEASEKIVASSLKEHMTLTEKIGVILSKLAGTKTDTDISKQIIMERYITNTKRKAQAMKIDTTMCVLRDIVETFNAKPVHLVDWFKTINFMNFLNKKGKLNLFYDLYLALKAKDYSNPLVQNYLRFGLDFLAVTPEEIKNSNRNDFQQILSELEKFKEKTYRDIMEQPTSLHLKFIALNRLSQDSPELSKSLVVYSQAPNYFSGDKSVVEFLDFQKLYLARDNPRLDEKVNFINDIKLQEKELKESAAKYENYAKERPKMKSSSFPVINILFLIFVAILVFVFRKKFLKLIKLINKKKEVKQ